MSARATTDTRMLAGEYAAMYQVEDRHWWYAGLRAVLAAALAEAGLPGRDLLDAGCGTGKNAEFLRALGYRVTGIELDRDAIAFCRRRSLDRIQQASVAALPFRAGAFDGAVCLDVLGLLSQADRRRAADELHRVLRPGGILAMHVAALEALRSQHDDVCNLRRRLTTDDLRRLFPSERWEIVRCSYRVSFLLPPIALVKLAKRLGSRLGQASRGDLDLPPRPVNGALGAVQSLENRLFRRRDFPVGSSAFLVARRRAALPGTDRVDRDIRAHFEGIFG